MTPDELRGRTYQEEDEERRLDEERFLKRLSEAAVLARERLRKAEADRNTKSQPPKS
jgi:hypothetical protein